MIVFKGEGLFTKRHYQKVSLYMDFLGEKLLQKFLPIPLFKNF